MFANRENQVYNVLLDGKIIGFFQGKSWTDAQRKAASDYNKMADNKVSWEQFNALWLHPKKYEENGIKFKSDDVENNQEEKV